MTTYFIASAWQNPTAFEQASQWFDTVIDAEWDWSKGKSYINGVTYPAAVNIAQTEDYIVFKLRWPELLKC